MGGPAKVFGSRTAPSLRFDLLDEKCRQEAGVSGKGIPDGHEPTCMTGNCRVTAPSLRDAWNKISETRHEMPNSLSSVLSVPSLDVISQE